MERPGWFQGNPVAFVVAGVGERVAESFEGNAAAAPLLHIEFTELADARPVVSIMSPVDGASTTDADVVAFTGSASDNEDGDLSSVIAWSSSIDGFLGTGGSFSAGPLSLGAHTITATVVDNASQAATATVSVTVTDANPPNVFETRIANGNDDAEERASGSVLVTSSYLELVFDGGGEQIVGLRFGSVDVPAGATITNAWIQFTTDEVSTGVTNLTIAGEAADNGAPFTNSGGSISSRLLTTATTVWTPDPWTTKGAQNSAQRSPNLGPIVAEVINQPGWTQNNAVVFLIQGTGERVAESYEGNTTTAPSSTSNGTERPEVVLALVPLGRLAFNQLHFRDKLGCLFVRVLQNFEQ